MKSSYAEMPNGYLETIQKGIKGAGRLRGGMSRGIGTTEARLQKLRSELETANAILIGAGAGLSTSAGFIYSGERFERWFPDFIRKYGFEDMYSGGFYPYPTREEFWAYWARYIYINRYLDAPIPVYGRLHSLVKDRDYFVITTNVDHCFQKAGFDRDRLFYTQGDYGLFQNSDPGKMEIVENEEWVMMAMEAQGFIRDESGLFRKPDDGRLLMSIPSRMIPTSPIDGTELVMNLRSDDSFVENEGWHRASTAYSRFLSRHRNEHVLYLELGVGGNTPVIIKYPFWQMTLENSRAFYSTINYGQAFCPREIEDRSIVLDGDIGEVLSNL